MERGFFITGTDTGVGKTRVACALAHALAQRGARIHVRKPVESGCGAGPDGLVPLDASALRLAAGGHEPLERVNAVRLRAPISPERAAVLEGVRYDVPQLRDACRAGVGPGSWLLVEGAGGFYSPLAEGALNADLAESLGLPVLVVAADRLGAINHVLLTVGAVRARGLAVAGLVLSQATASPDAEMDNGGELERWLGMPVARLTHGGPAGPEAWRREAAALAPWLSRWAGDALP